MNDFLGKFDSNNTYLEYNILSNDCPTIFIHGVGLDNSMWYPQKKYFENYPLIFYDILNHGKSKKGFTDLNFDLFSKQLLNIIQYLNLKKINLVGFSIGALIAQHFTEKLYDKINKLVLIGSVYNRTKKQISIVNNRYKKVLDGESISEESIQRWFTKEYLKKNTSVYNFFYNLLESKKKENFLPAYKVFIESDKYPINFKNFKMPTLIMTGEDEVGSPPIMSKKIHKEIKNSLLYIVNKGKHGITVEKAEDVNKQLSKFLFS